MGWLVPEVEGAHCTKGPVMMHRTGIRRSHCRSSHSQPRSSPVDVQDFPSAVVACQAGGLHLQGQIKHQGGHRKVKVLNQPLLEFARAMHAAGSMVAGRVGWAGARRVTPTDQAAARLAARALPAPTYPATHPPGHPPAHPPNLTHPTAPIVVEAADLGDFLRQVRVEVQADPFGCDGRGQGGCCGQGRFDREGWLYLAEGAQGNERRA